VLRLRAVSGMVLLAVSVAASLLSPLAGLAAPPPSAPSQITQRGFESGEPAWSIAPIQYSGDPAAAAWWGITPSVPGALGSNALWCARTTPSGTRNYTSGYAAYTRGEATLTVSVLQDYYSSQLAFRYLYTSRGLDDAPAFVVRWQNSTTGALEDGPDTYTIPLASTWTTRTRDMDQGEVVRLSRDAARVEFEFFDRIELVSQTGSGPAIDNVIVSGYKYGPVRALTATNTSNTITLDWLKSYRAVDETSTEERPVTFRVWRTRVGQEAWEELTTTRATEMRWVDSTPTVGALYEYAVQEWDMDTGAGYGELATVTAGTPDVMPPVLATNAVATYANAATVSVTASDSGRGVASLSYRLDSGATQTVASAQATVATSAFGPHTLRVAAVDAAGNQATPLVVGFTVTDTIAPSVAATASASYANTATVPVSAVDTPGGSGVHSIEYRLDNGTTQTVASAAVTVTTTSYGPRTLWYRARDVSGNWSATASKAFSVTDSLPPAVSASVSASYANTATIPVTAVETAGGSGSRVIEYRFDNSTTQTASNAFGVPSLTATAVSSSYGARTITYRARDSVGNWSAAVTQPFAINDTNAPSVSATVSASYTNTATIPISASDTPGGSGAAAIEYRLDNGTTQTVASTTTTVSSTAAGARTISYRARDVAGNWSAAVSRAFTITDTIAPSINATVAASYDGTASIPISAVDTPGGTGVGTIEYRFDNATTVTVAAASTTATTSSFGPRTISYRARDAAGNWSSVVAKAFSVTDATPPVVMSDALASYADTATIRVTATDAGSGVASVSWRVDGGATQTIAGAAATVTVVGYGAHTLTFWAADTAGSASPAQQAIFSITDSVAPGVSGTVDASYSDTATISITAIDTPNGSGAHSIEYRFDNSTTVTVAGATASATTTSYGARTIRYRARDVAGNWSAITTKAFSVTDSIPPTVTTDALGSYADTATIRLTAIDSGSGAASLSWRVDDGATQTVAGVAATVTVTGSGPHGLSFWATDVAGNTGSPGVVAFGIADGAAPLIGVSAPSGDNTVTVSISATDTGFGVRWLSYALDGGAVTTVSVSPSVPATTLSLAVGPSSEQSRSVKAWATDASGLVSSATASFRVTDTIVPVITHDVASQPGTATVTLTAADTGSGIRHIAYRFGDAATVTVTAATATVTTTTTGWLSYAAEDRQGNRTSGGVTVTVPPVVSPVATVGRISGSDRYAVAVGIARTGWPTPSAVTDVIIANGETGKEADPLAAAGLAGAYDAPVVLTQAARLPAATRSYLTQVAAARKAAGKTLSVHIVGGPASVPDARWNEIRAIPGVSATKDRLSGADRYAVTVTIANRIVSRKGIGAVNGVLIINAENPSAFYDALAASPIAFSRTMPMLGVKAGSVPACVGNALASGPLATKTNRYVVSSPTFVSARVYSQVKASKRLATKADRYAAAAEISTQGLALGMGPTSVGVASALPDALTGGALFGKKGGVMLFTTSTVLSAPTKSWLGVNKAGVRSVTVLGGTASVSDSVKTSIAAALK